METKHTKGPWFNHSGRIRAKISDTNFITLGMVDFDSHIAAFVINKLPRKEIIKLEKQAEANAKLIAAAPELLDSLIKCVKELQAGTQDEYTKSLIVESKNIIKRATDAN